MKKKNIAVILAGCGVYDGAEIHEATLTLLAIAQHGADYTIFAPDINQAHVINHVTGAEMNEKRNVLIESARIARGQISALSEFNSDDFDALIFPGGFGAAKNLSSFAFEGPNCTVLPEVEAAITSMVKSGKPIGALCIAPAIIVKVLRDVEVTIGREEGTANAIEAMGGKHVLAGYTDIVVDTKHKIVTTPCYMLDANILQIAEGAENVVTKVLEIA